MTHQQLPHAQMTCAPITRDMHTTTTGGLCSLPCEGVERQALAGGGGVATSAPAADAHASVCFTKYCKLHCRQEVLLLTAE
jgi:hypothetical protein